MKKLVSPFYFRLAVLSLILEWAVFGFYFIKPVYFNWYLFVIPVYFLVLFVFFHSQLLRSVQKRAPAFVSAYMLLTGIKLFLNIGVLIAFMFLLKNNVVTFAIAFLVQYFLFTSFEIRELLKLFSKNEKISVRK